MQTRLFDYHLPPALIAQEPAEKRDESRLLVVARDTDRLEHRRFSDITRYLQPGDVLVLNNTRVVPARFVARRPTGGRVEGLLLEERSDNGRWTAMLKARGRLLQGETLTLSERMHATLVEKCDGGRWLVHFNRPDVAQFLDRHGLAPLPPYIKRDRASDARDKTDRARYQTVFARLRGSVAAPTAGLHFTRELLRTIRAHDIDIVYVTLHVGLGTFLPIRTERLEDHPMHSEYFHVSEAARRTLRRARSRGARIVAVGSTSVRVVETIADTLEEPGPAEGWTDLFIYPPYRFKMVGAMITNFHLPKSTLLPLVAALCGRRRLLDAYREAIRRTYRFYSYGDAMLVL